MADDPTPNPTPNPAPKTPEPKEPEMFSADYVRELRQENARYRTKAKELEETSAKATKDAEESSAKVKADADARIIRAELKASALKAGMIDLDGLKLADLSGVKLNDAGEIDGADNLMEDLKKAKPYLFSTGSTSNPNDPPSKKPPAPKDVRDMTPDEYRAARNAAIRGR